MRMYITCTTCKSTFHMPTFESSANPFSSPAVIKEAMRFAPTNKLPSFGIVPPEDLVVFKHGEYLSRVALIIRVV